MPHTETKELAMMVDTFRPLMLTKAAVDLEDPEYWKSWQVSTDGGLPPTIS